MRNEEEDLLRRHNSDLEGGEAAPLEYSSTYHAPKFVDNSLRVKRAGTDGGVVPSEPSTAIDGTGTSAALLKVINDMNEDWIYMPFGDLS
jgi:hypothetical protein